MNPLKNDDNKHIIYIIKNNYKIIEINNEKIFSNQFPNNNNNKEIDITFEREFSNKLSNKEIQQVNQETQQVNERNKEIQQVNERNKEIQQVNEENERNERVVEKYQKLIIESKHVRLKFLSKNKYDNNFLLEYFKDQTNYYSLNNDQHFSMYKDMINNKYCKIKFLIPANSKVSLMTSCFCCIKKVAYGYINCFQCKNAYCLNCCFNSFCMKNYHTIHFFLVL